MNTGLIFFRVTRYLKYVIVSQNRKGYGIHSPFVFDLITRVFRNKTDHFVVCSIEKVRQRLLRDRRIIEVSDLGAGSEKLRNKLKKVSDIARYSAVPQKYGKLLANMAAEFSWPLVIEFGTSLGISTMYIAASVGDVPVISMEGCPAIAEIADKNFTEAGLKNIRLFRGTFEEGLAEIIKPGIRAGLVFIDGNHRRKAVLEYFGKIAEISENNTVVIIDDINYSVEMAEAWNKIRQHEKVTFTIDVFRMGIVFFRKGIGRKDYAIWY
jgi:predicted O-methyltransferase YrrM